MIEDPQVIVILIQHKETISKLIGKDFDYFNQITKENGVAAAVERIENIVSKIDASTKFGREIILARNDVMTKIIYYNRSVEDHENVSNHICESDLYKVYEEHLYIIYI